MSANTSFRILIVTRNFPPFTGGMQRLLFHVHQALSQTDTVGLVGPSGCRSVLEENPWTAEAPPTPVARFLLGSLWHTLRMARRMRPHLLLSGSGVAAWPVALVGRLFGIPTLCYLHGLDISAHHPLYRTLFVPGIRACDDFLVNSHNTGRLAEGIGIHPSRLHLLHPGVSFPQVVATTHNTPFRAPFRDSYALGPGSLLLSVGRLVPRKGVEEFVRHALPGIIQRHPKAVFVIIGAEPRHDVAAVSGMAERIQHAAAENGLSQHVRIIGQVSDDLLWQAYQTCDLFIFPVIEINHDVEGFGMVAVEAAAHGLPTVAFANGGIPDAVAENRSGYLVPTGDYDQFADTVCRCLERKNAPPTAQTCKDWATGFAWDRFGERLRDIRARVIHHHGQPVLPQTQAGKK